ncbi:MAG: hypothetical protein DRN30_06990 [Thermoplasmata archaeon]|nr:MAG: hypothetical protein DRN30_06990 [Thermoplasmata archaeon]
MRFIGNVLRGKLLSVFFPKYKIYSGKLDRMLKSAGYPVQTHLMDSEYIYTDFRNWMKIIKNDVVKYQKYRSDVYDCDNFGVTFAGLVPFIYGINAVGFVTGRIYDEHGLIGYHGWNVFLALKDDGTPELYMYEPQSGMFSTYKAGRIGNWKYEPLFIIWG